MAKISKEREKVAYILEKYPESRNSDNYLYRIYAQVYHGILLPPIEELTSFESISRQRRFLQAKGLFLAEDRVAEARSKLEQEYKKEHAQKVSGM